MQRVYKNLTRSLTQQCEFAFAGLGNKRKPTPKDLDKYDVVWVGCNLGGIASRHFDKVTHGKYKMMVVLDTPINQIYSLRNSYEMQKMKKTDYLLNAKLAVDMYIANSEMVGVKQIKPDQNKIVLRNGREIAYDHIVIAAGMNENIDAIKGFEEAWAHPEHPVFTAKDHSSWKGDLHKYPRWHYNFNNGDAYFCIPPYPFRGEVENYNFFVSLDVWKTFKWYGKQHPHAKLTILNANDRFVQYNDQADSFIKDRLEKEGVKVEYGKNLVGVDMHNFKIKVQDRSGKTEERDYNNIYSLLPSKPHDWLQEAGLLSGNGLLNVDPETLVHRKHRNIFGLGDVNDVPTTKTFFGGWQQIHVVRNNLARSLNGQSLNGRYDGFAQAPLYLDQSKLTFVEHTYKGATWKNVNTAPVLTSVFSTLWNRKKSAFLNYYLGKTYGAPYYKFPKKFKETGESSAPATPAKAH